MTEQYSIDPKIKNNILQTIDQIEKDYEVIIMHAIESGSRAWGFPSPNSDYDVRFFYVHKKDWYLQIYPGRDVIEKPVNEVYDISGWDLKKALHLALKSNAVVLEWLQSPIIYKTIPDFADSLKTFCLDNFDQKALACHYLSLGTRQIDQAWRQQELTKVKKYFYMLRPAIALKCLRENHNTKKLPMNLQELILQSNLPRHICVIIEDLVMRKRTMNEKDLIDPIPELDRFIEEQFELAKEYISALPDNTNANIKAADEFFLSWLKE